MSWNRDRIERLKTLWAEGWSAAQIAGRLGGVSRNAVLGKARRLGLASRSDTSRQRITRRTLQLRTQNSSAAAPAPRLEPKRLPASLNVVRQAPEQQLVKLLDLRRDMCRWPFGDPKQPGFGFCGRPRTPGLPYCAGHARRAFRFEKRWRT